MHRTDFCMQLDLTLEMGGREHRLAFDARVIPLPGS